MRGRGSKALMGAMVLAGAGLIAACAGSTARTEAGAGAGPTAAATTTLAVTPSALATSAAVGTTTVVTTSPPPTTTNPLITTLPAPAPRAGAVRYQLKYGPIQIQPGQNAIEFSGAAVPKPPQDGWIVRIAPNLVRADGSVPPVNVIHLHHGVWLNLARKDITTPQFPERIFAAGEEKTIINLPDGFGYRYVASDPWAISFMVHDLLPTADEVWLTYDIDLIPNAAAPAGMREARPIWLDVQNGEGYPVFDVLQGSGTSGQFTYPDDAPDAYGPGPAKNQWVADRDLELLSTAGHLHPGGLHTDLTASRAGRAGAPVELFRSDAVYYEPAGPVSWDVSMTATPPDWRVAIRPGDTLRVSATYDTARASWYESMGIMVVWAADGAGGRDPFRAPVAEAGQVTHGQLPENSVHGGGPAGLPDATTLPGAPAPAEVRIGDFLYRAGDTSEPGSPTIPVIQPGQSLTFVNDDAPVGKGIWHTVTACQAPCNLATGIAYPLANGPVPFDSGELGTAGPPTAGRTTWSTPADLPPGTYTYFCRIHPFMRGAFRVAAPGA